jgi:hypothetical protein
MDERSEHVKAYEAGTTGPYSEIAEEIKRATGAAAVALVVLMPDARGSYAIAGPVEAQRAIPELLEGVAGALRTQLQHWAH